MSSEGELNSPEPLSTILTAGGRIADLPSEHIYDIELDFNLFLF